MMAGLLGAYDAVDTVEDDRPPVRWPRGAWSFPTAAENPQNAWYVRTSLKGAASGPLAGKHVAKFAEQKVKTK